MSKSTSSQNRFIRYMKAPLRALVRARDFYVKSMTGCAGRAQYGAVVGCPGMAMSTLPRSFSTNSYGGRSNDDEDFRELMRVASIKKVADSLRVKSGGAAGGVRVVPRSRSVAIGRIDEDKTYDGEEDVGAAVAAARMYPRSRSQAVWRRTGMMN
ncbi:hypothetical protein QJS10_CPA02g00093 [Acorus calamus]|uniref:Uncharacterized protein n=1 Tax=Acorus calamus TaxID=4465 RepID=A0AAV9FC13_ACOCL|nr:hypothetical protein QJS10_CPA02g00093 [Acorus calamus]